MASLLSGENLPRLPPTRFFSGSWNASFIGLILFHFAPSAKPESDHRFLNRRITIATASCVSATRSTFVMTR